MTSISSYALTATSRLSIEQAQAALSKAQVEVSSGTLADVGLGLGGKTSRYLSLTAETGALQALVSGNTTTATQLSATTDALDAIRATASSFLSSLTGAASTGSITTAVQGSATSNLAALTATLNTTVAGQAIFAGVNTAKPPLTTYASGSPAKTAVDNAFVSTFGMSQGSSSASTITGTQMASFLGGSFANLFGASAYKATWSSASDEVATARISSSETAQTSISANDAAFRQLAQAYTMVQEFGGTNLGSDAGQAVVAAATKLVSSAVAGLTALGSAVGQTQNAVSDANTRMATQISYLSTESSGMVSVDATVLSTQISALQTRLQASYEVTARLQQLSLVNYIK